MKHELIRYKHKTGLPIITLLMGVAAFMIFMCSKALLFLQYDRQAIASGEVWRLVTGHWTHWSFDHFFWCTVTFVALGSVCERLSRKGYLATLAASIIIIPVVSWWVDPGMNYYRGLSGLASSVFVFGAVLMARKAYLSRDWPGFSLSVSGGLAFSGKVLFEFINGQALFVSSGELFTPVPLVHLVGGVVGLVMVLMFRKGGQKGRFNLSHIS